MRPLIAVSQRVDIVSARHERRDALDQRWGALFAACDLLAMPLPNEAGRASSLLEAIDPAGVLLTGGNDLSMYGGDAPERDATEAMAIEWAVARRRPLFAVCRGLQMLAHHFGSRLVRVDGHAAKRHRIQGEGLDVEVNSFHDWGFRDAPSEFQVLAKAPDGTIEAVRHSSAPIAGVMWHPEREAPFATRDMEMFRKFFGILP